MKNTPHALISVLLDKTAALADRDDAAMDLGGYSDSDVEQALLQVARDADENEILLSSCGESLAQIWLRSGHIQNQKIESLAPAARAEAESLIEIFNVSPPDNGES